MRGPAAVACLTLSALLLAACTIEVGPPPESDPPLVPQKAKAPPPPPQPSEPQPWSRDLNLNAGPTLVDEGELAEGLVAGDSDVVYSSERLTFESAFNDEGPKSEAERARERARKRAEAAGRPVPPEVTAAPVEQVSARELPPPGQAVAPATTEPPTPVKRDWRESRLPPPPKFPPVPKDAPVPQSADGSGEAADPTAISTAAPAAAGSPPAQDRPEPPLEPMEAAAQVPEAGNPAETGQAASLQMAASGPSDEAAARPETAEAAAAFAAVAWNAPAGSILVQVSAVQKEENVVGEWRRLQAAYPQVLEPLRLVVEEAKLGERGVFYRVQAGAFGTEEGATAACDNLIDAGQACFVVVR
ncbi:SPOR domain-containing protein [Pelagibius sp. CAU 1746]|uniref:SPOR domain-containing protein n=1 Tax=Pelagibius sp. CAU 1746 TaxID=3140370 RepID=UPI00325B573A